MAGDKKHFIVESGVKEITPEQVQRLRLKHMIYICHAAHNGDFPPCSSIYHIRPSTTWGNVNAELSAEENR